MLYLLLIFFPISMAFTTFLLRRRSRTAIGLAIGTLITELLLAMQVRVDDPIRVLGVTFLLSPLHQIFLFLFLGVGIVTLIAALILPHGENLSAIGLLTIGQTIAILVMQDSFVTALVLVSIGLTTVLAIVDLPVGAGVLVSRQVLAAALKYLVLMVISGILLYIAYVLTDIFRPGELPGRISPARFILALLAAGFALRMALTPFHSWLVDLVSYSGSLAGILLIALPAPASLLIFLLTLQSFPTLIFEGGQALNVLRTGAAISAVLASALALTAGSLRGRIAYLIAGHCGIIFYSFASLSLPGLSGAILGSINLALGVTAVLLSLALIEYPDEQLAATTRSDLFWQRPMAGAGLLGGGLALIGWFPFPGGTSYLLALQAAAAINWIEVLVLATAMALAALTLVQLTIQYLLGPRESSPAAETPLLEESDLNLLAPPRHVGEPIGVGGLIGVLLVVIIVIGLFPNLLLPTIEAAVRSLAVLSAS
ncbi:proton-conducting transporter transmembrane domain-containing protein [Chloroflexus aggregans]|uniref:NADH/ubiquinone/plastoquinone (Complex I) n=1 Tax=Chloroflexus aggregans (strain MD-66 / DSM 9485) TaxID=326427 RepID=B8GAS1_CHLAD|nr:proton-conducting transporter membrane subunit [Chloroflexus aggregans]ACL24660.1 NADH/ubiquinone/plastoquinone (complex I) [Chloroflexus aggregans DSM 9485]